MKNKHKEKYGLHFNELIRSEERCLHFRFSACDCSNIGLHMLVHLHNIYGRKSRVMVNKKEVNLELNNSKPKNLKNSRLTSHQ